jgi:hypothetical protein
LKSHELVKKLDLPHARGICQTLDKKYFVVSYGIGQAALMSPRDLTIMKKTVKNTRIAGSHLFAWDPTNV